METAKAAVLISCSALSVVFNQDCFETLVAAALRTDLYLVSLGSSCSHLAGADAQNTDVYLKEQGQCGYLYRNTTPLQRRAIRAPLPKYLGKIFLFSLIQEAFDRQIISALKIALNIFITTVERQKKDDVHP